MPQANRVEKKSGDEGQTVVLKFDATIKGAAASWTASIVET